MKGFVILLLSAVTAVYLLTAPSFFSKKTLKQGVKEIPPQISEIEETKTIPPEQISLTPISESAIALNTFKEVFAEIKNIPKSPSSKFIEESRLFILKGRIIKETREVIAQCIRAPCPSIIEKYDVYFFQDLINEDYKIQVEEKYLNQFSLKTGSIYILKGNVIYLKTPIEVKIQRFEPIWEFPSK